jgi:hypothetical protein
MFVKSFLTECLLASGGSTAVEAKAKIDEGGEPEDSVHLSSD